MGWNNFNPVNSNKNWSNPVDIAGNHAVNNKIEKADIVKQTDSAEDFSVNSFKLQGNLTRVGLEKSNGFTGNLPVDGKIPGPDKFNTARNIMPADIFHPGEANPPAAQGLDFSETKGASAIAYSAKLGEVYKFPNGKEWKVVDVVDHEGRGQSGFRGIVLQNGDKVIVAFAGTDPKTLEDIKTDVQMANGEIPEQFKTAVELTNKWIAKAGKDNVINTGHSLGGALATYASIQTGTKATTVNAAPLPINNIGGSTFDKNVTNNPNITNYYVPGEVLTVLDNTNVMDMRPGNGIAVKGKGNYLNPASLYVNHLIGNVAPDVPLPEKVG